MNTNPNSLEKYASPVLRIGISIVFLWFGAEQFLHTSQWLGFVPQFIIDHSPVSVETLVHFNGALELVFGTALLFGFFTRISAFILALHMAHITYIVGYDAIGIRDFGIVVATSTMALLGPGMWSLDAYLSARKQPSPNQSLN